LEPKVLDNVFEKWWPDLQTKVQDVFETHKSQDNTPIRSEREILEEVLEISRLLAKEKETTDNPISVNAINHMLENFKNIYESVRNHQSDEVIMSRVSELSKSITYIANHPIIEKNDNLKLQLAYVKKMSYECLPYENSSNPYSNDDDIPF
ncbi:MAG: hypothetical protein ACYTER_08305, partial [Planctomycetota bacterium]